MTLTRNGIAPATPNVDMGTAERPSRRTTGRLAMVGLIVLCAGGVGASFLLESRALDQAERDAVARASSYVDEAVAPVIGRSSTGPLSTFEVDALHTRVERIGDDGVVRVRLWSPSGTLLFSTDRGETSDLQAPGEVPLAADGSLERTIFEESDRMILATFVPTPAGEDPTVVAQVDQSYQPIASAVKDSWGTVRMGAGGAAAFFLAMLLLSFARRSRVKAAPVGGFGTAGSARPARRDGTYPESGLEKKLEKSEQSRAALEEQLDQLRTQMAGAEARDAERAQLFESRVVDSHARTKELEDLLRDAEGRAGHATREAPFTDAIAEGERSDGRSRELERELAGARSELEAARSRLEELEPLVAHSAASVEDAEARATQGARAADVRAKEAEARAEERERRLKVAETRVIELESFARDSEQRLAASADAAESSALRIRELEGKLEGARHDNEAALQRAEAAEASLEGVAKIDGGDGSIQSKEAERPADALQERVVELESHTAQLEELARSAEERAGQARFEADEAIRAQKAVEAKLEHLQSDPTRRDPSAGERPDAADLEQQLAEAHRAGKEAFRMTSEARAELERITVELETQRARVAELEARLADATAGAEVTPDPEPVPTPDAPVPPSDVPGEVGSGDPDTNGQASNDSAPEIDEEVEDGHSLRFRLARSAAQRKGRAKDKDQDHGDGQDQMWSSPAKRA